MNDKDLLPDELLTRIILNCNYKSIIRLKSVCTRYNDIIKLQSLLNKKCNFNFPRITGKAAVHEIKTNYYKLTSNDIIIDFTLNYIINKDLDIVNGDYILMDKSYGSILNDLTDRCKTKFIFYNLKLYLIDTTYNLLPNICQVIKNNVPPDYWRNSTLNIFGQVNINNKLIRDQCLNNMNGTKTFFTINNEIYHIKYDPRFGNLQSLLVSDNDHIVFIYNLDKKRLSLSPIQSLNKID